MGNYIFEQCYDSERHNLGKWYLDILVTEAKRFAEQVLAVELYLHSDFAEDKMNNHGLNCDEE